MYKGQLEGFPREVVEKMLEEQEKQGNKRDKWRKTILHEWIRLL